MIRISIGIDLPPKVDPGVDFFKHYGERLEELSARFRWSKIERLELEADIMIIGAIVASQSMDPFATEPIPLVDESDFKTLEAMKNLISGLAERGVTPKNGIEYLERRFASAESGRVCPAPRMTLTVPD